MIASGEFDNLIPAGVTFGGADCTHDCLGAGIDHAHHIDGWDDITDQLCHGDFRTGGSTEA